jgi:hypothetical protein
MGCPRSLVACLACVALVATACGQSRWSLEVTNILRVPVIIRLVEDGRTTDFLVAGRAGGVVAARESGFDGRVEEVDPATCNVVATVEASRMARVGDYYAETNDIGAPRIAIVRDDLGTTTPTDPSIPVTDACSSY